VVVEHVQKSKVERVQKPLVVLAGPTASGKTALSIQLAQQFSGEIVSCDSVAVYRRMEIGSAKPTLEERELVPHHLIDVAWPDEQFTAGDYSRLAREALDGISQRGRLPIVAGGTGLYLRALIDGLFPAPKARPELRERLRQREERRGPGHLHRMLTRLDRNAAAAIHANDTPKIIRAIEVSLSREGDERKPMTEQWQKGRDRLEGYSILRLGLTPPRAELYERINLRAAAMFNRGLVEETDRLIERYGRECRALGTLGYSQAADLLAGRISREEAVAAAQQGHRNYAKRQLTWFRREPEMHWLQGLGSDEAVVEEASLLVGRFLQG